MRQTRASHDEIAELASASKPKHGQTAWRTYSEPASETSASFHEADRELIESTFTFDNFSQAWAFMSRVALLCEKLNHHPEWTNAYNEVKIRLTTHESGSTVSQLDIHMAKHIDRIADDFLISDDQPS